MSEHAAAIDINQDADAQLGLRGAPEIKTVADFIAHQHELTHEQRNHLAHQLGLGNPRDARAEAYVDGKGRERVRYLAPTQNELGVARDHVTGKPLIDPDDPTLADRDCDPEFVGKSPEAIIAILEARELADGEDDAFWESMLQREVKVVTHGGGNRGPKKTRPKGSSAVDQAAIHSVAGRLAS